VSADGADGSRGPLRIGNKLLASLHCLVEDSGRNLVHAVSTGASSA